MRAPNHLTFVAKCALDRLLKIYIPLNASKASSKNPALDNTKCAAFGLSVANLSLMLYSKEIAQTRQTQEASGLGLASALTEIFMRR